VGILVLGIAEEFVFSAELCNECGGGDGTIVDRVMGNVQEEVAKGCEKGGRMRGDRGSGISVLPVCVCGVGGVCLWVWSWMCCSGAPLEVSSCRFRMVCRLGCCGLGC
jgi:hypothetical protein